MRLVFTKDANGDIKSQIQTGTILSDFSYTEMVTQLLENNTIEEPEYHGLEDQERTKIQDMLDEVSSIFEEAEEEQNNEDNQTESTSTEGK